MKTFVQYGAGNIGRGFIGQVFSQAGYNVKFIDINTEVIDALNEFGRYPIDIVLNNRIDEIWIENVSGIDGRNGEKVSEAIAHADLMATAVGVNVLPFVIPNIVAGIRKRYLSGNQNPLNIIICENLIDADKLLLKLIFEHLNDEEKAYFDRNVGLVEASIGRMVPIMTEEMKRGNLLRVCVERYCELPIDKDAFKGQIPEIPHLLPFSPFEYYIKRKLFIHNMGHCLTAFLGDAFGIEFIWQAIGVPQIKKIVEHAMIESSVALSKKFNVPIKELTDHVNDLIHRFGNVGLADTVERVGNDKKRKLSSNDRLIGAMRMIEESGGTPVYVAIGVALGLEQQCENDSDVVNFLSEVCGVSEDDSLFNLILSFYMQLKDEINLKKIIRFAEEMKVD